LNPWSSNRLRKLSLPDAALPTRIIRFPNIPQI